MLELLASPTTALAMRRWRARFGKVAGAAAASTALYALLAGATNVRAASLVISAVAAAAMLKGQLRERVATWARSIAERRRVELALLDAMGMRAPFVGTITANEIGEDVVVRVVRGGDLAELERDNGKIAAALRARSVRLSQDPEDASIGLMTIVRADPLSRVIEGHEIFQDRVFSLYQPVPLGIDENGNEVSLSLFEHHVLIGGEPGAGKSVSLSVLLSAAALDRDAELWLFDGKLIELSIFKPVAKRFVGPDVEEANGVLEELVAEMDARFKRLKERDVKKVCPGDGEPLVLIVIDELAFYVAGAEKKQGDLFAKRLRDLVARGRAAGIIVVAATQKPSTDLVPSSLRDLFSFRLAHRCATRDASDTVLGTSWAQEGYSAAQIDSATRGVGYLLADVGHPRRMRTYFLTDPDIGLIVRRGHELRSEP
jgi:hypothetical protein